MDHIYGVMILSYSANCWLIMELDLGLWS